MSQTTYNKSDFLDAASRIGSRIAEQAVWKQNRCTWKVEQPDPENMLEDTSISKPAGGRFYQGTAGIALFLGELYCHTDDPIHRDAALGGIEFSINMAENIRYKNIGMHTGWPGIAYSLARLGHLLDSSYLIGESTKLFERAETAQFSNSDLDVIEGAAGAILAGLASIPYLSSKAPAIMALGAAQKLIQEAFYEPIGWSWSGIMQMGTRHMCGYGHGASGIGHAFLELYRVTGADRYLYAALQALSYESHFREGSVWPDFRYFELGRYLRDGEHEAFRRDFRNGDISPPDKSHMSAWCHGNAGIAWTRIRAYSLLGDEEYADEARAVISQPRLLLDQSKPNYSLCHGYGGNSETLLFASDIFERHEYRKAVVEVAQHGCSEYEFGTDGTWPCGSPGSKPGPSLMLGTAGIGHFLLRLYDSTVPSCLYLKAPDDLKIDAPLEPTKAFLRDSYFSSFFGRSKERLTALGLSEAVDFPEVDLYNTRPQSAKDFALHLDNIIREVSYPLRSFVKDATLCDRKAFQIQVQIDDFTEEIVRSLTTPQLNEIDWDTDRFYIPNSTAQVNCAYDWDRWLSVPSADRSDRPQKAPCTYLLYRSGNRIQTERINQFTSLVLITLSKHPKLGDAIDILQDQVSSEVSTAVLREKVTKQLIQLLRIGAVQVVVKGLEPRPT